MGFRYVRVRHRRVSQYLCHSAPVFADPFIIIQRGRFETLVNSYSFFFYDIFPFLRRHQIEK